MLLNYKVHTKACRELCLMLPNRRQSEFGIMRSVLLLTVVALWCGLVACDTPANCTYHDIQGYWLFEESDAIDNREEKCTTMPNVTRKVYVKLEYPNLAVDKFGNQGYWTIIYNQGFEVTVNFRKYFAFSKYSENEDEIVSYCGETMPGWSHDVRGNNWACYRGRKVANWDNATPMLKSSPGKVRKLKKLLLSRDNRQHPLSQSYVDSINEKKQWKAYAYPELKSKSTKELLYMAGGPKSVVIDRPKPRKSTPEELRLVQQLPKSWDWRNVSGVNYVSPVRNQGQCGSCYAYASLAMLESRIRIRTNNTEQPIFSTQYIVDCSEYSQGCAGGFSYLIGGKFAQDFGLIEEDCYPYQGYDRGACKVHNTSRACAKKTYAYDYHYIGGYYGASNEDVMKMELVRNGPIAVGFMVYPDFYSYKGDVYERDPKSQSKLMSAAPDNFNPFELTDHAVLVVGYGTDAKSGKDYWIVKNSWGRGWGMDGYFWIRRGNDECGIESLAVAATPIPN